MAFTKSEMDKIFSNCNSIGMRLDNPEIINYVRAAEQKAARSGKLCVAFVSENLNALNRLVYGVFGELSLTGELNSNSVIRPFRVCLRKGDTESSADFSALAKQGEALTFENSVNSELFAKMDVLCYFTDGNYENFDWRVESGKIDYLFLVTNVSRLLGANERAFVQDPVQEFIGLSRFSLIVTGLDLINSLQGLKDVESRARWYLDSLKPGITSYMEDDEALPAYITEELAGQTDMLRPLAWQQSAVVCLRDIRALLTKELKKAEADTDTLKEEIELLKSREAKLKQRGLILGNNVYNAFTGRVIFNATVAGRKYIDQMCQSICDGLDSAPDLQAAADQVPGYVQKAMEQLKTQLVGQMKNDTEFVLGEAQKTMEADAEEFFESISEITLSEVFPDRNPMADYGAELSGIIDRLSDDAAEKKSEDLSKKLLIATVPVFLLANLPLAIGTAVASQLVKRYRVFSGKLDPESLKDSIRAYCQELTSDLEETLKDYGEKSAKEAEKTIGDAYTRFVGNALDSIARLIEEIEKAKGEKAVIETILQTELPELERLLD